MSSKQARPHSPAGTRLRGPDRDGNYEVIIPSASAPGTEHTLDVTYTGDALGCSCPGYRRYLDYLASLRTATPLPARRPCWHVEGAADLLAHHLDPPPADPGDTTPPGARHPRCPSMQCGIVGACCYRVCAGRLIAELGEEAGERAWWDRMHETRVPPADPGGATLAAAQDALDDEADGWEAELRRVRHDEGLRALYGD